MLQAAFALHIGLNVEYLCAEGGQAAHHSTKQLRWSMLAGCMSHPTSRAAAAVAATAAVAALTTPAASKPTHNPLPS